MRLENKTALITGGNSGIGLATARLFLAEGARVAITGRNPQTLEAASNSLGAPVLAVRADVTDVYAIDRAVARTVEAFGNLDIVFANAGVASATPLGRTPEADFDAIIRTNLNAVFLTVQAAFPHLNEGASIVLTGSNHAALGVPGFSAYAASKAGVRAMARNLAAELAPRRIRVNTVTPGATRTPIWSRVAPSEHAMAALEKRIVSGIPLARMADAAEVARVVLFLASDEASNVTGTEIMVDGGATDAPRGAPIFRVW